MIDKLQQILREISDVSPHYIDKRPPQPFSGTNVRAIFLGADPGTWDERTFDLVFCLEDGEASPYFRQFLPSLRAVKLSLDNLYVQNLCQNYFKGDTQRRRKDWLKCASLWIPFLRDELDSINPRRNLPVLISAHVILEALSIKPCGSPQSYYLSKALVKKNQNHLHRTLIPFFRGGRGTYRLDKPEWSGYARKIALQVMRSFA